VAGFAVSRHSTGDDVWAFTAFHDNSKIIVAIAGESVRLTVSVRSLVSPRHGKSSGELEFSDDLKSDFRKQSG
jgi:hypothetical protein